MLDYYIYAGLATTVLCLILTRYYVSDFEKAKNPKETIDAVRAYIFGGLERMLSFMVFTVALWPIALCFEAYEWLIWPLLPKRFQ